MLKNIKLLKFRTINENDEFSDLAYEELVLFSTALIKLQQNLNTSIGISFRGVNDIYLKERLTKDGKNDISESDLLKRLFYFGDKSKHYFYKNSESHLSKFLTDIDDVSISSNEIIFNKLKMLSSSTDPHISDFVDKHKSFFKYFDDPKNKSVFAKAINKCGIEIRNYYLIILHTAEKIGVNNEKSTLISTSKSYNVAHQFTNSEDGYIIIYITRKKNNKKNKLPCGLPYLNQNNSIFPEEEEITLEGALFAHNMLGVIHPKDQILIVNPHIFCSSNIGIDLAKQSLSIDQSNFEEDLKQLTSYIRWLYTYDYNDFHHGGAVV